MSVVGRVYVEPARAAGKLSVGGVLQLQAPAKPERALRVLAQWSGNGPRNVLVQALAPWMGVGWGDQWFQADDGSWWRPDVHVAAYVRPFRGLRRLRGDR